MNNFTAVATLRDKKILLYGLGREGQSTYHFLRQQLPQQKLFLTDDKQFSELDETLQVELAADEASDFLPSDELVHSTFDFVFLSPGINPNLLKTKNYKLETLTSNTELFFEIVEELRSENSTAELVTIGVTGTKGKSTTTALIHQVLKESGLPSYLGGNIGTPPLDLLSTTFNLEPKTYFVLELSSHQLRRLTHSPNIAVIQTIVPEHLDMYVNFEEYAAAKSHIVLYQTEDDMVIYLTDNPTTVQLAQKSKGKHIPFGKNQKTGYRVRDGEIYIDNQVFLRLKETQLRGEHNLLNILPSIIIGQKVGIADSKIKQVIENFSGLPHRLEQVASIAGVDYINDSLSTNQHAVAAAIAAFATANIILIAGGSDERHAEYRELAEKILNANIKKLILISGVGEKIAAEIKKIDADNPLLHTAYHIPHTDTQAMLHAVAEAQKVATAGDVVLLSPGAPSFDMFKDYADRGEQFKQAVTELGEHENIA